MEIVIKDLCKYYYSEGRRIEALSHVDLVIPANKIFTLLGPSGCGKTTLLRCIVGLETPDAGEIAIGDEVVWSRDKGIYIPTEKRGLSMVFQTYAIWPHMTVFDNVAYPLQTRRESREVIAEKVGKTLRFVQLEGLGKRPATKLSGGQQQRVALARALVAEPKVILFDEPLSNLDAKLREETRKELRAFLSDLQITAVYVTHDRLEALSLSDTVAVMLDGRVVEQGTPKEIYFGSAHRFVADFIGRANLIKGSVVELKSDSVRVDSEIGEIHCRGGKGVSTGAEVSLCVRPEFISVSDKDPEKGRNTCRGRVESLVFVGDAYEGEILVGSLPMITRIEPDSDFREGDEVYLHFKPEHCTAMMK